MTRSTAHQYVALYVAIVFVVGVAAVRWRTRVVLFQPSYWRWLLAAWKLATFAVAMLVLVVAGPYTGDCDWDAPVSVVMSALTFATAPYAVGELWRRRSAIGVAVASCSWMLSTSWSFDLYWFARRGFYPDSWLGNLLASSMLYLAAGLMWNLDWTPENRWMLAFRESDWPPSRPAASFRRLALPVLATMTIIGACLLLPFFLARF
jgi:hypothetical protein